MVVTPQKTIRDIDTEESDVENAVRHAGFGKFNIKIAIIGGLIYMNTGLSIGSVSFILPSAACDLQLSTLDKGRISASPILGMVAGSYFWGCFADVQGRRLALLYALFLYGIIEITSSVVTTYWLFLLLKFLSGWVINGQSAIGFIYLGEFQSNLHREKILSWMEMAWTIGLIVVPLIGWAIIPLEFSYVTDKFSFRSWNLFIIVCALPSFLVGLWLLTFPETPKYLAETKQDEKFVEALEIMHSQNTGGNFDEYLESLCKNGHDRLRARLTLAKRTIEKIVTSNNVNKSDPPISNAQLFLQMMRTIITQSIKLMKPPHRRNTFTACVIMYCIGSSYYALMLWFPEVFQRFATFEKIRPEDTASVCTISSSNWTMNFESNASATVCPSTVQSFVYLQTLILGLSCLPVSIVLPLTIHKLGYNFYLMISTTIAAMVTVGFFFVRSSTENLVLSCIFEAFSSVCMSTMLCIVVDLFPTDLRAMAAALSMFSTRLGALIGNTLFGYLIDDYCIPLIAVITVQLAVSAVLSFTVPGRKKLWCR
ncbi:synaptic vesicle glycoprotein 2B-like [Venturia canescens]|uniref:synaptic vesicle glycoprotein 2B-like n=1 Tax=Venturia canescens TaxID=32260 RepID=UPI001C9C91AF|nr:synaptic vesicle glycoprotein 2B-like [Venturia canescens]